MSKKSHASLQERQRERETERERDREREGEREITVESGTAAPREIALSIMQEDDKDD